MTDLHCVHVSPCRGLDQVAEQLSGWWSTPPSDPFATDLLVTPGSGHHRWFSQQLASRHGITAGVATTTVPRLIHQLQTDLLGIDRRRDPWSVTGLAGVLLDLIELHLDQPWLRRVREHLHPDDGPRPGRRVATAQRFAALLLSYSERCPEMVRSWNRADPVDPAGRPLDELWQYELWVRAKEMIDSPDPITRRVELLAALADQPPPPQRTAVVCLDPLSPFESDVIVALGRTRDLRLWQVSSVDPGAGLALSRLAISHHRSRLQTATLARSGAQVHDVPVSPEGAIAATGLHRLQQVLRGGRVEPGPPNDGTVQVHASHGLDRQIEVVREVLVGLFEADHTLEPRDVVLICTDPTAAASLLDATFGLADQGHHPGHRLRVQTSGLRPHPNATLEALSRVLALPSSRATATDLLDLCADAAIRHRFGFSDDDLVTIRSLISRADIRWGLDQKHRTENFDLPIRHDTWFAGIERLLLGAAMSETTPVQVDHTVAVEQVSSQDLQVTARLAELVSRLRKLQLDLAAPTTAEGWLSRLEAMIDLLIALPRDQSWQISAARAALRHWSANAGSSAQLSRPDMRLALDRLILDARGRPAYGNGNLQVVGLDELRAVPHRVVVLLGLDEHAFPVRVRRHGDDLTARHVRATTVDARERSQSSFIDAVMAAREHLVLTYAHRDPHTNDELVEPVVISELRQALDAVSTDPWQRQFHSLQPHSINNFRADSGQRPFSFDRQAHAGAAALSIKLDSQPVAQLVPQQWRFTPADLSAPVSLDELVAFWRHPAKALLQSAIGTSLRRWDTSLPTSLPLELFGRDETVVGNRLLAQVAGGLSIDEAVQLERSRGVIPVPPLDKKPVERLTANVQRLSGQSRSGQQATDVPFSFDLDQTPISGVVRLHGTELHSTGYANLTGADLVSQWISLLALRASGFSGELLAHLNRRDSQTLLAAPGRVEATALLRWFLHWRSVGLSRIVVAPLNQQFTQCQNDGTWSHDIESAKVPGPWSWVRDADWKLFTSASWPATARSSSGVEDLTVVALGQLIFGRIAQARVPLQHRPAAVVASPSAHPDLSNRAGQP